MVLILDGISEIGAHVWRNLCSLICLRHLIGSREVTNPIIFSEKTYIPSCVCNLFWVTIKYKYHGRKVEGFFNTQRPKAKLSMNLSIVLLYVRVNYFYKIIILYIHNSFKKDTANSHILTNMKRKNIPNFTLCL